MMFSVLAHPRLYRTLSSGGKGGGGAEDELLDV